MVSWLMQVGNEGVLKLGVNGVQNQKKKKSLARQFNGIQKTE